MLTRLDNLYVTVREGYVGRRWVLVARMARSQRSAGRGHRRPSCSLLRLTRAIFCLRPRKWQSPFELAICFGRNPAVIFCIHQGRAWRKGLTHCWYCHYCFCRRNSGFRSNGCLSGRGQRWWGPNGRRKVCVIRLNANSGGLAKLLQCPGFAIQRPKSFLFGMSPHRPGYSRTLKFVAIGRT